MCWATLVADGTSLCKNNENMLLKILLRTACFFFDLSTFIVECSLFSQYPGLQQEYWLLVCLCLCRLQDAHTKVDHYVLTPPAPLRLCVSTTSITTSANHVRMGGVAATRPLLSQCQWSWHSCKAIFLLLLTMSVSLSTLLALWTAWDREIVCMMHVKQHLAAF